MAMLLLCCDDYDLWLEYHSISNSYKLLTKKNKQNSFLCHRCQSSTSLNLMLTSGFIRSRTFYPECIYMVCIEWNRPNSTCMEFNLPLCPLVMYG